MSSNHAMVAVSLSAELVSKIEELKQDREGDRCKSVEEIIRGLCQTYVSTREMARRELAESDGINRPEELSDPWEEAAERGDQLLRLALANQPAINAALDKAFLKMGISGKPVGAEKVQQMIAECGFKPEDNEFSRGIIAMREE